MAHLRFGLMIPVVLAALGLAACGGGGGGGGGSNPPPSGTVTVTGTVTFDRPGYTAANTLDWSNLQHLPVRGATVEILRASDQSILATTTSSSSGSYSATVPTGSLIVRVKAEMVKAGTGGYDFKVRNNTSGNALYSLDSTTVTPTGSSAIVNLNAATGWNLPTSSYTGTRAAAPFAILYMFWEARTLLQGAEPNLTLPALNIYWSPLNNSAECADGQPDPTTGDIGTTFFLPHTISASANCAATPPGIYVLGDASGNADDDTDEFDSSIIAHELGHYFQDNFSRDDTFGGPHYLDARHDLTLAFSEGWGNAFQGFVLNSPWYRDTFGTAGNSSFAFDMENNTAPYQNVAEFGFFAEASIQDILWDVYDGANEPADQINLGYAPIQAVMRNQIRTTNALTSIYVMANGLATDNPTQANAIATRLAALPDKILGTTAIGTPDGDFGVGEGPVMASVNNNWPADPWAIPLYKPVAVNGAAVTVVSTNRFADIGDTFYQSYNRLGSHRYLRIDLATGGGLGIQVQGPVGSDPDFSLYKQGADQCPTGGACWGQDDSVATGIEVASFSGLAAGTYVLDVYECSYLGELCRPNPFGTGDTTFTVTVTQ